MHQLRKKGVLDWPGFAFLFKAPPGAWGFGFRTGLSACLALYAAFQFQLESPYWAPTTALIVANPVFGQIVSKSIYRILGTIVGVIMALLLTACFAQTPELFTLALACWVGCCLTLAGLLRNFQAYGATLAGFTTAIITLAVIAEHPLNIFTVAMARMSAIFVGVAASAVVSGLLKPGGSTYTMGLRISDVINESAKVLEMLSSPREILEVRNRRRVLAGEILTLDQLITFAASESPRVNEQRDGLTSIGAALLHVMTAMGSAAFCLIRLPAAEKEGPLLQQALAQAALGAQIIRRQEASSLRDLDPLFEKLKALEHEAAHHDCADTLVVIHRLQEGLEGLASALGSWLDWKAGRRLQTQARFDFFREVPDALRSGGRCFLAVGAAGAFWIYSAWPTGANLVIIVTVVCSFAATQPDPLAFGPPFFFGACILIPIVMVCVFLILPYVSSFIILALVLMAFIMVGCLASCSTNRWVGGAGRVFLALFFTTLAVKNQMVYDFSAFLNASLAILAGVGCAVISTMLLLPPYPRGRALRLVGTLYGETEALARRKDPRTLPARSVWESQMYDRLRLSLPYFPAGTSEFTPLDRAYAAVLIGSSVIDLRNQAFLPEMPELSARVINQAIDRLTSLRKSTRETYEALTAASHTLIEESTQETKASAQDLLLRCASSLRGIALLLVDQTEDFKWPQAEMTVEAHA